MAAWKIDQIDKKILEVLQREGRKKRNMLAEEVKLSLPSVSERLRKLEANGVIRGYGALVDQHKVGLDLTAFIFVISESSSHYAEIVERAMMHEEIMECHAVTGQGSHLLKVRTRNTASLEKILSQIQQWPGVKNTITDIVLSSPKESMAVSLKHLPQK